jgi:phosphoribulokinase
VRFDPIEDRGESPDHLPSATILLRPTVPHADVAAIITEDVKQAVHLKLIRDDDGKPVDAIHVHGYASPGLTRPIEEAIWADLDVDRPLPPNLGMLNGERSPSLALTQLLLLHHVLRNRESAHPRPEENT